MLDLNPIRANNKRLVSNHELIRAIFARQLVAKQYEQYLIDVFHYATHSSRVIGAAASRLVNSHPELSEYLFRHAQEELGHDAWARSDLRDLGMTDDEISASRPSDACLRMLALEFYYSHYANPVGLFGWLFTLECLGGDVGGSIATALDKCLSLDGRATYFLAGHGEADAHHSSDLDAMIRTHVKSKEDERDFVTMARLGIQSYLEIFDAAYAASGNTLAAAE